MLVQCPGCGNSVGDDSQTCAICSTSLSPNLEACPDCKGPLSKSAESCPRCGFRRKAQQRAQVQLMASHGSPLPLILGVLLLLLVGGIGAVVYRNASKRKAELERIEKQEFMRLPEEEKRKFRDAAGWEEYKKSQK